MDSTYPAYIRSINSAPTMDIPDHVDGIIDLKTLEDIHQQLSVSSTENDQELAIWIKEHYLYEPITQPGRQIRTAVGFSQLDRAFRRVRTLTNKAQDKWPFFDRKWKEMPSSTVRNNARGESAPGIGFPGMPGPMRGLPVTNGHIARPDDSSASTAERQFGFQGGPAPSSFVSFGSAGQPPIRHRHQRQQVFSLPIPNSPVPLPSSTKASSKVLPGSEKPSDSQDQPVPQKQAEQNLRSTDDLPKYTDFFSPSEGPGSARSASVQELRSEGVKVPSEESKSGLMPESDDMAQLAAAEVAREAGNGKVRGLNGRYLTKPDSKPRKARRATGGRRKGRKLPANGTPSSTPAPAETSSSVAADAEDEDMEEHPSSTPAPLEGSSPATVDVEDEGMEDQPSSPADVSHGELDAPESSDGATAPSSVDIALAPALTTANDLDKSSIRSLSEPTEGHLMNGMELNDAPPADTSPASLFLAAEAEAIASNLDRFPPNSNRKNKRKSEAMIHQGPPKKRGRPRKVDIEKNTEAAAVAEAEKETETQANNGMGNEVPQMATRRTTRRSTAANVDHPAPVSPEHTEPVPKKQQKPAEDEDETMVDVEHEDTTDGHEASPLVPSIGKSSLRASRSKVQPVPETPTQTIEQQADEVDMLALGLRKTDPSTERTNSKQSATQEAAKEIGSLPNGISKPAATQIVEPKQSVVDKSVSAVINGNAPTEVNESGAQDSLGKVEYLARVHTSDGIVELLLPSDNLTEEAELVQKYAEWITTKGAAQVTFEVFKSIFALSKGR